MRAKHPPAYVGRLFRVLYGNVGFFIFEFLGIINILFFELLH